MQYKGECFKLGLIGLGNQGQEHLHAQANSRDARIVAGYDISPVCRAVVKQQWPEMVVTDCLEALLAMPLNGLVLALPHHAYPPLWPRILESGLPLLKEKPLGRNLNEARVFVAQAKKAGCLLQTAIQRREHPSYQFLANLLKGTRVQAINLEMSLGFSRRTSDESWRGDRSKSGGGALLDCGYHMVDLAHYLVGSFDLVSAVILAEGKPCAPDQMDDAMELVGRKQHCWLRLSARTYDEPSEVSPSGHPKQERVAAYTDRGLLIANREGVWCGEPGESEPLYRCDKNWQLAMAAQLDRFAQQQRVPAYHSTNLIGDQLPAQHLIEQAYQLAFNWHGGLHATQ